MKVHEGKLDDLRTLMSEMVESTQAEAGTLAYEWFLSEDSTVCHLYERYQDSEAAMLHLGTFGERYATRFLGCLEPIAIHVYGEPSADLHAAHELFGSVFLGSFGGFTR